MLMIKFYLRPKLHNPSAKYTRGLLGWMGFMINWKPDVCFYIFMFSLRREQAQIILEGKYVIS